MISAFETREVRVMRRAAQERARSLRVWRQHLKLHGKEALHCACENQAGRFRKGQRIGGCGNARCYLCHGDKLLKRPSRQQQQSNIAFREALKAPEGLR